MEIFIFCVFIVLSKRLKSSFSHAVHGLQGFVILKINHVMHGIDFLYMPVYNVHVIINLIIYTMINTNNLSS